MRLFFSKHELKLRRKRTIAGAFGESICGSSSVGTAWQTDGQCVDGKPVAGM